MEITYLNEYNEVFREFENAINSEYKVDGEETKKVWFYINDEKDFDYTVQYYHYMTSDDIHISIRYISACGMFVINCTNTLERYNFINNFNYEVLSETTIDEVVKFVARLCNKYSY